MRVDKLLLSPQLPARCDSAVGSSLAALHLSCRDVEDRLVKRRLEISNEIIGAKVVSHGRYGTFQRAPPAPA
jgi:hypothetical protein